MFSFARLSGFCIALILFSAPACPQGSTGRDGADDPDSLIKDINEGELNFLEKLPDKPVHHHQTTLVILPESIRTGWVSLRQCHEHLDPFPRAQIVYHQDKIRNLELISQRNIGDVRVEGATVQLTDVGRHARLCIQAQSRALISRPDGTFIIQNGPFMRKFLDGYFPMRVTMDIRLPRDLVFAGIEPAEQKGFRVSRSGQLVHIDARFEGRLVTRIKLKRLTGVE